MDTSEQVHKLDGTCLPGRANDVVLLVAHPLPRSMDAEWECSPFRPCDVRGIAPSAPLRLVESDQFGTEALVMRGLSLFACK